MKLNKRSLAVVVSVVGWLVTRQATVAYATDHPGPTCEGTFAAADNPHRLTGNCTVPASGLTIEPGVTLNGQNFSLSVQGTLTANGTAQQPITFTNVVLSFNTGSGGSVTNNTFSGPSGSVVISISEAGPTISNNTFTNTNTAVSISGTSATAPQVSNNTLSGVTQGIFVSGSVLVEPTVSGNQITALSVGIAVGGSARPTISNNTVTISGGTGVQYSSTAAGTASGNIINFQVGGGGGRTGIDVNTDASPVIQNNQISDDPTAADTGIALDVSATSAVQVQNNTICATGTDIPIRVSPGFFGTAALAQISGTTLSCGLAAGIGLQGTLAANAILKSVAGQSSFVLTSSLTVNSGVQLTIPAGFSLNGQNTQSLSISGTLQATGAQFTGVFWSFSSGSGGSIANSTITGPAFSTGISISDASPSFTGNTFQDTGTAISLSGTTNVLIDANTFTSTITAITVGSANSRSTVSHNTFTQNTNSVSFATTDAVFSAFPAMFATNTFVGTADKNTVQLSGSLNVSGTLPATPVAYSASGLTVTSGVTVIIQAGAVIQSSFDALITVDGDLEAIGTAEAPIIFTTQTPKSGNRWRGLRINNKTAANPTRLNAAIVEFAGSFGESAVRLSNADSRIENSLIVDNNNDGIELLSGSDAVITGSSIVRNLGHGVTMTSSNPVLDMNSIFNNAQNGAQNNTCPAASSLIDAENNYWGDDTGPNDSSDDRVGGGLLNATGLGDEVSDCVDYLPWIRLGPSVEGTISVVSGGGQSGMVGTVLPQPLVVEIRSLPPNDLPLENIDVTFSIMEGDGSIVETQPVRTDIDGRASAQVRLGLTPGPVTVTVTARDVNSPLALFTAAGTPNGGLLGFALEATPLELAIRPGKRGGVGDVNNDGKVNNSDAQLTLLDKPAVAPYVRVIWCGVARVIRGIPMGGRCFLHGYSRLVLAERRW